jgi:hypothetical protein
VEFFKQAPVLWRAGLKHRRQLTGGRHLEGAPDCGGKFSVYCGRCHSGEECSAELRSSSFGRFLICSRVHTRRQSTTARENRRRKSCCAPANNHFIYASHRQHSCGKKDLWQRFFTTDENVTLSPHTRLQQFLADRQGAVLKKAKEMLGGWSALLPWDYFRFARHPLAIAQASLAAR